MKKLILVLSCYLLSESAQALVLFEPIIGYNRGQNQASRTQGLGLGARIGFEYKNIFIAGDIGYHEIQQGSLSSVKYNDVGVSFGGDIKNFRFWYGLISTSSYTYKSGTNDVKYSGAGTKIGLGAELSSKMYLNFELRTLDYTTTETAGVSSPIAEIATIGFLSLSWIL